MEYALWIIVIFALLLLLVTIFFMVRDIIPMVFKRTVTFELIAGTSKSLALQLVNELNTLNYNLTLTSYKGIHSLHIELPKNSTEEVMNLGILLGTIMGKNS